MRNARNASVQVLSHPDHQPNNGMHPTADTTALININLSGRRVMPGVSLHK
jgi:hypothetical protein